MDSHVTNELVGPRKSFAADGAETWFLARVGSPMTLKIRGAWKT
jgi:hypothetical protein